MKQKMFTESISSLQQGDTIRLHHTDLELAFPEGSYEATVMGIERVDTFGYKALLNIASHSELVTTKRFDLQHRFELLSWQKKPVVSVFAENLEPGDMLTSWGHDILVLDVERGDFQRPFYTISTKDLTTNEVAVNTYQAQDRFLYKLRSLNEKELRAIFERMIPSAVKREDETPEQFTKRIIRQAQEWSE